MKKVLALILCVGMIFGSTAVSETINLGNMSFDELIELQESIEQEMKTRNIKKLDFKALTTDELQELIVQSLFEMCSREEWVNELSPSGMKAFQSLLGRGVSLIFSDAKDNYYTLWLYQDNIELNFSNSLELILQHTAEIQINGK